MAGTLSRRWRFGFNFLVTVLNERSEPEFFWSLYPFPVSVELIISEFWVARSSPGCNLGESVRCREVLRSYGKTLSDSSRLRVFVVDRGQALPRRREESPSVIGIDLLGYVLKMIETEEVF